MKVFYLIFVFTLITSIHAFSQTTLTEDANGVLNTGKVVTQTSLGQIFYTAHQLGTSYAYPGAGIFRAWTDNPNGTVNYFYDGVLGGTTTYSVRADGQGYFATKVGIGTPAPLNTLQIVSGAIHRARALTLVLVQTPHQAHYFQSRAV